MLNDFECVNCGDESIKFFDLREGYFFCGACVDFAMEPVALRQDANFYPEHFDYDDNFEKASCNCETCQRAILEVTLNERKLLKL